MSIKLCEDSFFDTAHDVDIIDAISKKIYLLLQQLDEKTDNEISKDEDDEYDSLQNERIKLYKVFTHHQAEVLLTVVNLRIKTFPVEVSNILSEKKLVLLNEIVDLFDKKGRDWEEAINKEIVMTGSWKTEKVRRKAAEATIELRTTVYHELNSFFEKFADLLF